MFLETSLINFGFSLKVKINRFRQNYQLHSRFLRRTKFLFTKSYTRNSLLKHFQANNVFEVLTDVDGDSLAQWFLTGGRQNFLGGCEPLRVLQHGKFDQYICQRIHLILQFIQSQEGLKQKTVT